MLSQISVRLKIIHLFFKQLNYITALITSFENRIISSCFDFGNITNATDLSLAPLNVCIDHSL